MNVICMTRLTGCTNACTARAAAVPPKTRNDAPPDAETPEFAHSFQRFVIVCAIRRPMVRGYSASRIRRPAVEFPGSMRAKPANDNMKGQWIVRSTSKVAILQRQHKTVCRSRVMEYLAQIERSAYILLFSLSANCCKQR